MSAPSERETPVLQPYPSNGRPAAAADPRTPPRTCGNGLRLGPRTRQPIRSIARVVNPLVLQIAGTRHMPVVGIIHHRGRKTGRPYATPLGIRPAITGGYVMRLTFGESAAGTAISPQQVGALSPGAAPTIR